jgi:hypothetical protein
VKRQDEEVLRLLLKEQLITKVQETRLRAGLKRGMSLNEAVSRTPLVDTVKLASIQSIATQNLDLHPQEPERSSKSGRVHKLGSDGGETLGDIDPELRGFRIENLGPVKERDEPPPQIDDGVPTYDLEDLQAHASGDTDEFDDLDLTDEDSIGDTATGLEDLDLDLDDDIELKSVERGPVAAGEDEIETLRIFPKKKDDPKNQEFLREVDSALEQAFEKKTTGSRSSAEVPVRNAASEDMLEPLADPAAYMPTGSAAAQTYDLADSEGITLIEKVNGIFIKAVQNDDSGFRLDPARQTGNLQRFGSDQRASNAETIDHAVIEKVINRIKVMARLEPWRPQATQKGMFRVRHEKHKAGVYVQADPAEDREVLTVHIAIE